MIWKSMPSGCDPTDVQRFSLATNAEGVLRGDHAQTKGPGAMAIEPDPIAL